MCRLEEELLHKRSLADISSSCQTSGPARRSFFHRHRHRNNSRDSHELSSFSDASLNSDSVHHLEGQLASSVHSGFFYSASSSPLLPRGAPDTARILCPSFTPKRHRQLRVKYLPNFLCQLERDSNPQPFGQKAPNLPMSHHRST